MQNLYNARKKKRKKRNPAAKSYERLETNLITIFESSSHGWNEQAGVNGSESQTSQGNHPVIVSRPLLHPRIRIEV